MSSRALTLPGIAVLVAACALVVSGAGSPPTAQALVPPQPLVLSPKAGQAVRANVVRVRVQPGRRGVVVAARLNGEDLTDHLKAGRAGARVLEASLTHGLRPGPNVLRVTALRPDGRRRSSTVRFRVPADRPLVGAGVDRRIVAGAPTPLLAEVRRGAGGPPVRGRWSVTDGPRGARIASPAGATATLRARERGVYTLAFTGRSGTRTVSDRLVVEAGPDRPQVTLRTDFVDTKGRPGIKVGDTVYLNPEDIRRTQVLVLDRSTLKLVANKAYSDSVADWGVLVEYLSDLTPSVLVIVAQGSEGVFESPYTLIGGPQMARPVGGGVLPSLSMVGVPGLEEGAAQFNYLPPPVSGTPARTPMVGFLAMDQLGNFGFVPGGSEAFAFGGATPSVGDCQHPGTFPACDGATVGYRVTVQDSRTLATDVPGTTPGEVFNTGGRDRTPEQQTAEALRMAAFLDAVEADDVVTIRVQADRDPQTEATYAAPVGKVDGAAMAKLAVSVARVGGTRNGFNVAALTRGQYQPVSTNGHVYGLVGWGGAGEGNGAEMAAGVDGAGPVPVLSGVLRPDRQSRYRPVQVKNSLGPTNLLGAIALQPASRWPGEDDPGVGQAITCIGQRFTQLGGDPRSAYWSQGVIADGEWLTFSGQVAALKYEDMDCDDLQFDERDFASARKTLQQELEWVGNTWTYLHAQESPWSQSTLRGWAEVHDIADSVENAVNKPTDTVAMRWLDFTDILLKLLGPATDGATTVMAESMDLGLAIYSAEAGGGPSDLEIRTTADQIATSFITHATRAQLAYDGIGRAIVSDYDRLRRVGSVAGCNPDPSDPDACPQEWRLSGTDITRAESNVLLALKRLAYTKLLPLGYPVLTLTRTKPLAFPPDPHEYDCSGGNYPFKDIPPTASTSLMREADPVGGLHGWETFVLSTSGVLHGTPPPDNVLATAFGPVNAADPTKGGLGISITRMVVDATPKWWEGSAADEAWKCE